MSAPAWCAACDGTGEGPVSRVLVTTCPHRLRFERSNEMILGWTCPEHLFDCPRVYAEDDGPCPACKGTGLAAGAAPSEPGDERRLCRCCGSRRTDGRPTCQPCYDECTNEGCVIGAAPAATKETTAAAPSEPGGSEAHAQAIFDVMDAGEQTT